MRAFLVNCSLKGGRDSSSTDRLLGLVGDELRSHGVVLDGPVRVVDRDVKPGVTSDEGDGDAWPALRRRLLAAEILVFGTPIWLGHPSSVAQRVLERLDAFLGEQGADGRPVAWDRVAVVAVVGNEDGAHHVTAELYQGLGDVGFTIPAAGATYWVGEAMQKTDFRDLDEVPTVVKDTTAVAVRNAVHLARLLAATPYPSS